MSELEDEVPRRGRPGPRRTATFVLLALPFVACLYPGWYNHIDPEFFGVPFFITYQMALVFFGSAVMAVVYLLDRERREPDEPGSPAPEPWHDTMGD